MNKKGVLIVLEGVGGAGKTTQAKILAERFRQQGEKVFEISFPRYEILPYGPIIKLYLNNEFGDSNLISPYLASIPFTNDRLDAKNIINQHLNNGEIVISTRYTASNMAYQLAKMHSQNELEKQNFINWLINLEYRYNKIPKEDLLIVQYLSAKTSLEMIDARSNKNKKKYALNNFDPEGRDGHESSQSHLEIIIYYYKYLANIFPHWREVNCSKPKSPTNKIKSEKEIHEEIWKLTQEL